MKPRALLLLLVACGCQTAGPEIVPFKPREHCDAETMALSKTVLPVNRPIDGRKVREVFDAYEKCGRHAHEVASVNTRAANEWKDRASAGNKAATGFGAAAGVTTVLAVLALIAKIVSGGLL
jgi:hypothetical protein